MFWDRGRGGGIEPGVKGQGASRSHEESSDLGGLDLPSRPPARP